MKAETRSGWKDPSEGAEVIETQRLFQADKVQGKKELTRTGWLCDGK